MDWFKIEGNYKIYTPYKEYKSLTTRKIAIFDSVGTLITSRNGSILGYDKDPSNFILLGNDTINENFKDLIKKGYLIIILCKNDLLERCDQLRSSLRTPAIFVQTPDTKLKTLTMAIEVVLTLLNIKMDRRNSFYSGDAVSKKDAYPPYRYSSLDFMIAKELGIKFKRPIDIFGNMELKERDYQELVLAVGNTGSGKSTSAQTLINRNSNYVACDTDAMPRFDRALTLECTRDNLISGKSVIVIATNANIKDRNDYISIAREMNIPVRIAWFIRDGRPFNFYRGKPESEEIPSTFQHKRPVPVYVYDRYTKMFQEPTLSETNELEIIY
jgi:hypothetical protein